MNAPEIELPLAYRRQSLFRWPEEFLRETPISGQELVVTTAPPVLLSLHPRQSEASLRGALALVNDTEAMLREFTGFDAYVWGSAGREEALNLSLDIIQKWKEMRPLPGSQHILWIHAETEARQISKFVMASGWYLLTAEALRQDLARLVTFQGATVLFTNAAVERLGSALGSVVTTCRSLGCLCGLSGANLHWFAAGFWPPSVGIDFAVIDLTSWCGGAEELAVIACASEIEPFLPHPRWRWTVDGVHLQTNRILSIGSNAGPIGQIPLIASCYASLRRLGGEGVKRLSRQAAILASYVHKKLALSLGEEAVHSSLLDVWISDRAQRVSLFGWESDAEIATAIRDLELGD